jgi:hypothetical protein
MPTASPCSPTDGSRNRAPTSPPRIRRGVRTAVPAASGRIPDRAQPARPGRDGRCTMRLLPLVAAAAAIPAVVAAARLRHILVAVRVVGISMQPTLLEGERVLVRRTTRGRGAARPARRVRTAPTPTRPAFSRPPALVDQTRVRAPQRPRLRRPPPQHGNWCRDGGTARKVGGARRQPRPQLRFETNRLHRRKQPARCGLATDDFLLRAIDSSNVRRYLGRGSRYCSRRRVGPMILVVGESDRAIFDRYGDCNAEVRCSRSVATRTGRAAGRSGRRGGADGVARGGVKPR